MASLAVGEASAMYAQAGVMRAGASRANDHSQFTFVKIAGVQYAMAGAIAGQQVDNETLTIKEEDGETPNVCDFEVRGFQPLDGQEVIITLGSINNYEREFAGTVLTDTHGYVGSPANGRDQVHVIDFSWQLTRDTISQRWTNVSATVIAKAMISVAAGRGFTSRWVEEGLPVVDEFTVTNQTLISALAALADRVGAILKVIYNSKDVRFGLSADARQTEPLVLTPATAAATEVNDFSVTRDLSQVITRQPVEGGGSTALVAVPVGATVLPVEDDSWYNPLGGTVVSGPQRIDYTGVAFGVTSTKTWVPQPSAVVADWVGIAWSPTLNLFAAVSAGGSSRIQTSPDGFTWTERTSPAGQPWQSIVWAPALALFVAVGSSGAAQQVMTSPDGITWTARTAASTATWVSVTWSPALGRLVAVAQSGASQVMTSSDGITWTSRAAAAVLTWRDVAWSPALNLFVAVAISGTNPVMTSPDGITWTQRTTPASSSGYGVGWSAPLGLFVVVGSGYQTLTSPDGVTWTARPTAFPGYVWEHVIWVTQLAVFMAVSSNGAGIWSSSDGITWTAHSALGGIYWMLAEAPSLYRVVAVGSSGAVATNASAIFRQLTGIPASGVGSILYTIRQGDPVNIRVVVNDLPAQAAVAAMMLPLIDDGVIEGAVIQDGRISETEARARGTAWLALRRSLAEAVALTSRDLNMHAGRSLGVNLPIAPTSTVGTYKVQSVTSTGYLPARWPARTVQASSSRFTLEMLLRIARGGA